MANVVTEHIMLMAIMIVVIFVFSTVANTVVNNYITQQLFIIAQGAVNQLGSTIQQLHYCLSQQEITPCTVVLTNPLPATILSYPYKATGILDIPLDTEANRKLTLTLSLQGMNIIVNKTIVLFPNSLWNKSELLSSSSNATINLQKFTNGTILLGFK